MSTLLVILLFLGSLAGLTAHSSSTTILQTVGISIFFALAPHFVELLLDLDVLLFASLLSMVFGKDRRLSEIRFRLCFQFSKAWSSSFFLGGRKTVRICVPSSALACLILLDLGRMWVFVFSFNILCIYDVGDQCKTIRSFSQQSAELSNLRHIKTDLNTLLSDEAYETDLHNHATPSEHDQHRSSESV